MARRARASAAAADGASAAPAPAAPAAPPPEAQPRRRRGVMGPTSALTSFLADLGVQAPRTNFAGTIVPATGAHSSTNQPDPTDPDPAGAVTGRLTQAGPTEVGDGTPEYDDERDEAGNAAAGPSRRRARGRLDDDADSDALDEEEVMPAPKKRARMSTNTSAAASGTSTPTEITLKGIGEFMKCAECQKQFTVTAYTKPHPAMPGYLCFDCTEALGIDPFGKTPKKRAPVKGKGKKEERGKITHYEERKGTTALGDLCIKLIGKYIEDVEVLGDIGAMNMEKVCRIICKSRRLTPETASLFYSAERKELRMYDCTKLVSDSYITLCSLCPNLETLQLDLCGQIDSAAFVRWSTGFKHLRELELDGPFLVRVDGWKKLCEGFGKRLEVFKINQQPRFDKECLEVMVKQCPNIEQLRLSEFGLINDDWLPIIAKLKKLTYLDLARPGKESLTDDAVVSLLSKVGSKLEHLDLSRHVDLSDAILDGIAKHCPNLKSLRLEDVSGNPDLNKPDSIGLTDDGVAAFFEQLASDRHIPLTNLDFHGCHSLQGPALTALLKHSGAKLKSLNISGWKDVSGDALSQIGKTCKELVELDIGWCRRLTDFVLKDILEGCPEVKHVRVWGCNNLTDAVPRKKGCRVVGIETHAI